jgi:hypothetical protein
VVSTRGLSGPKTQTAPPVRATVPGFHRLPGKNWRPPVCGRALSPVSPLPADGAIHRGQGHIQGWCLIGASKALKTQTASSEKGEAAGRFPRSVRGTQGAAAFGFRPSTAANTPVVSRLIWCPSHSVEHPSMGWAPLISVPPSLIRMSEMTPISSRVSSGNRLLLLGHARPSAPSAAPTVHFCILERVRFNPVHTQRL